MEIFQNFYKKNARLIFIVITITLIATAFFLWRRSNGEAQTASLQSRTATVEKGSIRPTLVTTGVIIAGNESNISPAVNGEVTSIEVSIGDTVTVGHILATIDSDDAKRELDIARSKLTSAKIRMDQLKSSNQASIDLAQNSLNSSLSSLQKAEAELAGTIAAYPTPSESEQLLIDTDEDAVVSASNKYQADLINLQSKQASFDFDVRTQQEQVHLAEHDVSDADDRLKSATITSPISGSVIAINASVGDQVGGINAQGQTGDGQSSSSSSFIQIVDLNDIQIKATIDQADIPKIAVGQGVGVNLDALPDKDFKGSISSIDPVANTNQNVTTYVAYISLDKTDPSIRLGMSADVKIDLGKKDDVLLVPNIAVRSSEDGKVVQKIIDGEPVDIKVITGLSDENNTEIVSGLLVGDEISLNVFSQQSPSSGGFGQRGGGCFGGGFRPPGGGGVRR